LREPSLTYPLQGSAEQTPGITAWPMRLACPALPVEEYALLVRTSFTSSSIVVGDSGNLPRSASLPFEVFAEMDRTAGEGAIIASPDELARNGLQDVFGPDPTKCVKAIPIADPGATDATLLVKTTSAGLVETVKAIHTNHAAQLSAYVAAARAVAVQYEWQVLSRIWRCSCPCVVAEPGRTIVAVNSLLCDILGRSADEVIGTRLEDLLDFERQPEGDIPFEPQSLEITTSTLIRPLFLFFVSNVGFARFSTVCGDRLVCLLQDISTDRRAANSNILLIQKLSGVAASEGPPQVAVRKLINLLALTLRCDLVCVLRRKARNQMIVTPHSNRRLDTLMANVIEAADEPVLEPFFTGGNPVFCDNVEAACPESSFFRRIAPADRFAVVPIGDDPGCDHAMLAVWSKPECSFGPEGMHLLKTVANLVGGVLAKIRMANENQHEKEALRRYTRLTAGRETKMASLKRENAELRDLVTRLGADDRGTRTP
jgi:PAS domain-containing protein